MWLRPEDRPVGLMGFSKLQQLISSMFSMKTKGKIARGEVISRRGGGRWVFESGEEFASICDAVDLVFEAVMLREEARSPW